MDHRNVSTHQARSLLVLSCLALGACTTRATSSRGQDDRSPGRLRWSGSLQPTQQRTGEMAPTAQTKAFGTVVLTVSERNPNHTRARITLSAPIQSATELRWAILPGGCGTGSLPLAAVEQFPVLEISSNGRGELDAEVPLTLPTMGTYHVNVYWRGQQVTDVMTCANLRREGSY
jgi:hypothetical protein